MTIKIYHNFLGIDIGKFSFAVAVHSQKNNSKEYENNLQGITEFLDDYRDILNQSLCILETTGGYELELLYTLCSNKIAVHRADSRKVKSFIRSYGNSAKTDNLDAKALALYGYERYEKLELFTPLSKNALSLFALLQRRLDLKQMLVAEKNSSKSPGCTLVKKSCQQMIKAANEQVELVDQQIQSLISSDPILKEKQKILQTVPGIGKIISSELVILLPELGKLDRRRIASLCGVAPRANDSGTYQGYRRTGKGRKDIKPILFVAAMAARNSNSPLKLFYENLISKGKKKMVALTALMRKIIVIANARIKEFQTQYMVIKI